MRADPPTADGGVPRWLADTVRFCSRCGGRLAFGPVDGEERSRLSCAACGFVAYVNPRVVVATLPVTERGEVVLVRRGIEPGYGAWAQPGGFLEIDETAHEGAVRETLEETRLVVEPTRLVGIYSRPHAAIVVVCWQARIVSGTAGPTPESLEVRAFAPADIPWLQIAFDTTTAALRDWLTLGADEAPPS